jgi:hypothetical protein
VLSRRDSSHRPGERMGINLYKRVRNTSPYMLRSLTIYTLGPSGHLDAHLPTTLISIKFLSFQRGHSRTSSNSWSSRLTSLISSSGFNPSGATAGD